MCCRGVEAARVSQLSESPRPIALQQRSERGMCMSAALAAGLCGFPPCPCAFPLCQQPAGAVEWFGGHASALRKRKCGGRRKGTGKGEVRRRRGACGSSLFPRVLFLCTSELQEERACRRRHLPMKWPPLFTATLSQAQTRRRQPLQVAKAPLLRSLL